MHAAVRRFATAANQGACDSPLRIPACSVCSVDALHGKSRAFRSTHRRPERVGARISPKADHHDPYSPPRLSASGSHPAAMKTNQAPLVFSIAAPYIGSSDAAVRVRQLPWAVSLHGGRASASRDRVSLSGIHGALGVSTGLARSAPSSPGSSLAFSSCRVSCWPRRVRVRNPSRRPQRSDGWHRRRAANLKRGLSGGLSSPFKGEVGRGMGEGPAYSIPPHPHPSPPLEGEGIHRAGPAERLKHPKRRCE
jgi:hypothetical protein